MVAVSKLDNNSNRAQTQFYVFKNLTRNENVHLIWCAASSIIFSLALKLKMQLSIEIKLCFEFLTEVDYLLLIFKTKFGTFSLMQKASYSTLRVLKL